MKNNIELLDRVLSHLGVEREEPNLALLNRLIEQHQRKVTWENVSKFLDWEKGSQTGNFLPSVEDYFNRMINHGFGGTCWTLAVGFHWILKQLGFTVHYIYMDPGHLCLRVDLDQDSYYVDLGYCAPLFQAYPLYTSFIVHSERETFDYQVNNGDIKVVRTPGPTKTLSPIPVTLEEMQVYINKSNQWETAMALQDVRLYSYIDQVPTSITTRLLTQHSLEHKLEQELSDDELRYWVSERFKMDWDMFQEGIQVFKRHRKDVSKA